MTVRMILKSKKLSAIILTVLLFISIGDTSIASSQQFNTEINLYEGWNLIGLPFTPEDPSIEVVLEDISDNVAIIWGYDNGEWQFYRPAVPELGNLT